MLSSNSSSFGETFSTQVNLKVPFAIIAGISFTNSLFFLAMRILYPSPQLHPTRVKEKSSKPSHANRSISNDLHENKKNNKKPRKQVDHDQVHEPLKFPKLSFTSYSGSFSLPRERNDKRRESSLKSFTSFRSVASSSFSTTQAPELRMVSSVTTSATRADSNTNYFFTTFTNWLHGINASKVFVVVMSVAFMHIYYGLEITFGTFLTTFCHESPLHLATTEGATVTSTFWATFAFWRLPTIFIVDSFGPIKTVVFNLIVLVIGNIILVPWASSHRWALYTGTALIGLGASPIWASMFSVLELFFPVSPPIATAMITASMMGELVFPTIVSRFIACQASIFLWVALFCSCSVILLFAAITFTCIYKLKVVPTLQQPQSDQESPGHGEGQQQTQSSRGHVTLVDN